jgi:hypothetical protein
VRTATNLFSLLVCAAISMLAIDARAADLRLHSGWLDSEEQGQRLAKDDDDDEEDDEDSKKKKSSKKKSGKTTSSGSGSSSSGVNIGTHSSANGVSPQGRQLGIGIQLGAPTALTIAYMVTPNQGIHAGIGAGLPWYWGGPSISLFADYVWHPHVLATGDVFKLSWFVGGGVWGGFAPLRFFDFGYVGLGNPSVNLWGFYYAPFPSFGTSIGARVPLGVNLALAQLPIEIYAELVPSMLLFPAIGLGLGGTVGGRFYF